MRTTGPRQPPRPRGKVIRHCKRGISRHLMTLKRGDLIVLCPFRVTPGSQRRPRKCRLSGAKRKSLSGGCRSVHSHERTSARTLKTVRCSRQKCESLSSFIACLLFFPPRLVPVPIIRLSNHSRETQLAARLVVRYQFFSRLLPSTVRFYHRGFWQPR